MTQEIENKKKELEVLKAKSKEDIEKAHQKELTLRENVKADIKKVLIGAIGGFIKLIDVKSDSMGDITVNYVDGEYERQLMYVRVGNYGDSIEEFTMFYGGAMKVTFFKDQLFSSGNVSEFDEDKNNKLITQIKKYSEISEKVLPLHDELLKLFNKLQKEYVKIRKQYDDSHGDIKRAEREIEKMEFDHKLSLIKSEGKITISNNKESGGGYTRILGDGKWANNVVILKEGAKTITIGLESEDHWGNMSVHTKKRLDKYAAELRLVQLYDKYVLKGVTQD
jgi:hypothetical protein